MFTITLTEDEGQYLLNALNTHVKTHGLKVATTGVVILAKLQAAADQTADETDPSKTENEDEPVE